MKKKTKKIIVGSTVFSFLVASIIGLAQFFIHGIELENAQQDFLEELENNKGTYDEKSIVLNNTSFTRANELSERLNAKYEIKYETFMFID